MIKKITSGLLILALSTSCVSKKIYNDLENKYADLKKENRTLADGNDDLLQSKNQLELDKTALTTERDKLKAERDKLLADYTATDKSLKTLHLHRRKMNLSSCQAWQTCR